MDSRAIKILIVLLFLLVPLSLYSIFIYAPIERAMGEVQKIFYYHLGAAMTAFIAFFVVFICGIFFLMKKEKIYDIVGSSSAEIGVVYTTIVLITGMLWAKPIWNVWWTWDSRLTTTFILWLIYISYGLLRFNLKDNDNMPIYAAIFGIIGFLDVPLVFMSIRWWRTIHPVIIKRTSIEISREMLIVLIISIVINLLIFLTLMLIKVRIEKIRVQIEDFKNMLEE